MKLIDLTGQRFGRLTVLSRNTTRNGQPFWNCTCSCGGSAVVAGKHLRYGAVVSCGCYLRQRIKEVHSTHRMSLTAEYVCWAEIKRRCYNQASKSFKDYGARGIKMCDEWLNSFPQFFHDMGPKPTPTHSIERRDTDANYSAGNCKWALRSEQANNKRSNRRLTLKGITKNLTQWSKETGLSKSAIEHRLERGWTTRRALETPRLRIHR